MNQVTVELLVLLGTIVGLFVWNRSESREDIRILQSLINENRIETQATLNAIHLEMKDFHGRLCAIEAGKKKEKKGG
jgi:hypothetical protein